MPVTNTVLELREQGWRVGNRALSASATFSTEDEPSYQHVPLGLFRTEAAAKRAVVREVKTREKAEKRDGWWTGDVEVGQIAEEVFSDKDYGQIIDWSWERDERENGSFYMSGQWQR